MPTRARIDFFALVLPPGALVVPVAGVALLPATGPGHVIVTTTNTLINVHASPAALRVVVPTHETVTTSGNSASVQARPADPLLSVGPAGVVTATNLVTIATSPARLAGITGPSHTPVTATGITVSTVPTVSVRIAFGSNPYDVPIWTDVTSAVQAISTTRGRSFELDDFQPGTASVLLNNIDRRFDPTNAASPYAPNILPRKRINIQATYNNATYDLFTGFVDAWPPTYPGPFDSDVLVTATDGFKMLTLTSLIADFPQESAGDRVVVTLGTALWPPADRNIAVGNATVLASQLVSVTALDHLRAVRGAEQGQLFINAGGQIVFQSRYARVIAPFLTPQATFGELGTSGELPYVSIAPSFDDTFIYNLVQITGSDPDSVLQQAIDPTSITQYGMSAVTDTSALNTDTDAFACANMLVGRYKQPKLRIDSMVLDAQANPTSMWPQMLGREISDRITVHRRPPGGGAVMAQDCHIESVTHTYAVADNNWQTTWMLSPVDPQSYFVIDSSTINGTDLVAW